MEEINSAVALTERPAYEPLSTSPFPPPAPPPLYPPGDFYSSTPTPPHRRGRARAAIVAVVALVGGATLGVILESGHNEGSTTGTTVSTPATSTPVPAGPLPTVASASPSSSTELGTEAIVALVDPAVVDITTTIDGGEAAGTGMVLTPSGLVLTNNHVIDGATKINVQIAGSGPTYNAHVVGYDVTSDIALIQIENVSGLTTISVGDSTSVAVGDRVVAIGNALGSDGPHAVSTGAVEALDQTITANDLTGDSESLSGLIQTDASIQPGDSGGPLVGTDGRVIGINAAASVGNRRGGSSTAEFAIPIATAMEIAQQIQNGQGSPTVHIGDRAILGVKITSGGSLDQSGVRVASVTADGPAVGAGIEAGATITAIDQATIGSIDDLDAALFPHSPGDQVEVTWTDAAGTSHTATVQLAVGPPA